MYAIIQHGGHQLRVAPGERVLVDRFPARTGDTVSLDQVLLIEKEGGEIVAGSPFVAEARVTAVVEGEQAGPKIRVFKKKRRKGTRRTIGHRSKYTCLRITGIEP